MKKQKTTNQGRDFKSGAMDHKAGYYDKWYRYNRIDEGAQYDAGFNSVTSETPAQIIECMNGILPEFKKETCPVCENKNQFIFIPSGPVCSLCGAPKMEG